MVIVLRLLRILHCCWVVMILAGLWDFTHGLSCRGFSFRGMNETDAYTCDTLCYSLTHVGPTLGDDCFDCGTRMHWKLLHGEPARMKSCSHLRVNERTSQFWTGERIQNVFMNVDIFAADEPRRSLLFDRTLGFPGEGPKWAIISANIDSFSTNANCLHWQADAFLLQEARIADSNMIDAQRKAALCNFHVFCSQPLQKVRASNGNYRIPSGGTATCANREVAQLFDAKDDVSGVWPLLCSTARVTATWHQVSETVKLLAFNFYAIANAASERAKFERNNELLHQIFTVAAQYGDIPIVLAGDFQMEPGMYPSVQLALDHWGWADPLLQADEHGLITRPATFFQHNAATDADGQSSIDGVLVNRTALTALLGMEVLLHQDRQHRPVCATFAWDRIQQKGTVLQRAAKLNLEHLAKSDPDDPACQVSALGEQLWKGYEGEFTSTDTADAKWKVYNDTLSSCCFSMGLSGRMDHVFGGASQSSRLFSDAQFKMTMVAVLPHIYSCSVPLQYSVLVGTGISVSSI